MGEIKLISDEMPDLLPVCNRSPGVHVSDVIRMLCVQSGIFDGSGKDSVVLTNQWAQLGNSLEDALVRRYHRHYGDRYTRPGEMYLDGVYGTPDLLDTQLDSVDEIKLAWMSSSTDPASNKFWRYWAQTKSYCKMTGRCVGRLHITHINGNYKGGPGPHFRLWEKRFTPSELDTNWQMVLMHADKLRQGH